MRSVSEIQADINEAEEDLQACEDTLAIAKMDQLGAEAQIYECEIELRALQAELAEAKKASVEP